MHDEWIAVAAGPYNLVEGLAPEIEPWSPEAAAGRLARVGTLAGIDVSGAEHLPSHSNDAWRIGDAVLRICWRGDRARMLREAQLVAALPTAVPSAPVLDAGSHAGLSWVLSEWVGGTTLADAWSALGAAAARPLLDQLLAVLDHLHQWTPPFVVGSGDEADDALAVVGRTVVPFGLDQVELLGALARTMPFVDPALIDAVVEEVRALDGITDGVRRVVLHGDTSATNVVVREGEIAALLDFEWARTGPVDLEPFLLMRWSRAFGSEGHPVIEWLYESCPELTGPDAAARQRLYRLAFELRGVVVWPAYCPEAELVEGHPVRQLRALAS